MGRCPRLHREEHSGWNFKPSLWSETFVYRQAIENETYLKELEEIPLEETLAEMEFHQTRLDGLDVETGLAFAEHVVVNAKRLWNEYDPRRKRHSQRVLFPEGLAFGNPPVFLE